MGTEGRQVDYLQKRVVFAAALWDLVAVAPLALPWTAGLELGLLNAVAAMLGLPGQIPDMADGHLLFVNMAGCCGLIWIAYRLFAWQPGFLRAEFWIRCVFAALLGYYAFATPVGGIGAAFAVTEVAWAGICYWAMTRSGAGAARPIARRPVEATDLPR